MKIKNRIVAVVTALGCVLGSGGAAWAQNSGPVPEVGQPVAETQVAKETVYNFIGDKVIGDFQKPGDILVTTRNGEKLDSLITVRADFIDAMMVSAEDL